MVVSGGESGVACCPGVAGVGVEAAEVGEEFVIAVWAGAVSDEEVYHFAITLRFDPFWIILGDGGCGFDEVAVVEVVVV